MIGLLQALGGGSRTVAGGSNTTIRFKSGHWVAVEQGDISEHRAKSNDEYYAIPLFGEGRPWRLAYKQELFGTRAV